MARIEMMNAMNQKTNYVKEPMTVQKASELLDGYTVLLSRNELKMPGLRLAQAICFEFRDVDEAKTKIAAYTKIADAISDGLFSESIAALAARKTH